MKCKAILMVPLLAAAPAWAQTVVSTSVSNNTVISLPDGNTAGVTEQFTLSGLSGSVANVQLQLNLSGGFNGDLYAYLVNPQGQMAVLLNRSGVNAGNAFGYADAGMAITLDGAASANIHDYQSGSYSLVGGQLTGTWAADGRNVDPLSAGSVFDSAAVSAGLNLFTGVNAADLNGTWTLFIADLAAGGGTTVVDWTMLTVTTIPEPQPWLLVGSGLAVLALFRRRKV